MKFFAHHLEILFICAMLLIFFTFFWTPDVYFAAGDVHSKVEESDPFAQSANIALIGFLAIGGIIRRAALIKALHLGFPILAMVGLAFLSAWWSDDPALVIRRSGVLALSTLLGFYIYVRFELPELIELLVKLFIVIGVASYIVVAIAPGHGIGGVAGEPHAWRGAFVHKNILGYVVAVGSIVSAYAYWNRIGSRRLSGTALLLTAPLLILSQSKTALLLWPAGLYAALLGSLLRRRDGLGLVGAFVTVVFGIAAVMFAAVDTDRMLTLLGRGSDFSGRIDLWHDVIFYIGLHPWLGYGFGGFWRSNSFEANQIWATVAWAPPHSHNGWLELALNLGLLGVVTMTLLWFTYLGRLFRLLLVPQARFTVFYLILFAAYFTENLTETALLRQANTMWVLFVIAFLQVKREALAHNRPMPRVAAAPMPIMAVPRATSPG